MKFSGCLLALSIFSGMQAAQHQAHALAQKFITLVGEQYGEELSMSIEFEAALDALYSDDYREISNFKVIASSKVDFKEHLKKTNCIYGFWKVTDVGYIPDNSDTNRCEIVFRWWTEKKGVFDIKANMQSSSDGMYIKSIKKTVVQVCKVGDFSQIKNE